MTHRATYWPTNAAMIAAVAEYGYIYGRVLDATYGFGNFWTDWKPDMLITNDLYQSADHHYDFTKLPFDDGEFDTVVFDPPYKLNGTPSEADYPYGVHVPTRWQDRMELIRTGTVECARVCGGHLLVKCMDQVVSGEVRWQTDVVTAAAGLRKVDRFDFLNDPRPQPPGRRQLHAEGNYSTLLIFAVEKAERVRCKPILPEGSMDREAMDRFNARRD